MIYTIFQKLKQPNRIIFCPNIRLLISFLNFVKHNFMFRLIIIRAIWMRIFFNFRKLHVSDLYLFYRMWFFTLLYSIIMNFIADAVFFFADLFPWLTKFFLIFSIVWFHLCFVSSLMRVVVFSIRINFTCGVAVRCNIFVKAAMNQTLISYW